ncbi:TonB-dependent receptor [Bowmanella dokdonensis]|uniref:TonB-dependent receptor n=1 Tax=Bowmanella dokdonensis TaxID=751969 RepID=A0A939DP61_9ALTE|nr:TonB-dependent receptor [Bowmanella dokdonensis]MBN7826179.1 TonB-dependent receptor [Bowmanella dokdonensis]
MLRCQFAKASAGRWRFSYSRLNLVLLSALSCAAVAQQEASGGTKAERSVEVIKVTATRQTENLQDVPIAITALSANELAKLQVQDLGDLKSHVPNLTLHSGDASNAVIYIRGVGQIDSISFNDPGVGVYLDDVYMGRVQGSFLDVVDPQQIEVLRGPQGTLYGRNTIGGAVKFTSAKPTAETQGYVDAGLGNYGYRSLKGTLSGAVAGDSLLGRLSVARQQRDGYATNLADGSEDYDKDTFAWRGSLLYEPGEAFSAYLVLDGSRNHPDASRTPHRETPIYSVSQGAFRPARDDPFEVNVTYNDLERLDTEGVALTLSYQVGDSTLKSISSYREMEYRTHLDLDASPDESFGIYNFEDQSQFSQELQWLYRAEGFSLVSGLYYFDEDDWSFGGAIAPAFFVPLAADVFFPYPIINAGERVQDNRSSAAYLNLTYALSERLNLTLGARYTREQKEVVNRGEEFFGTGITTAEQMEAVFGTGVGYGQTGYQASEKWNAFTPKLVLDYQYSDSTLWYASASKGFKSGGFNGRLTSFAQPFDPETLWSYEIGSKSMLMGNDVRLNSALFYNDYQNFQLSRFSIDPDTGAFLSLFENAGEASIYGAELELDAVLSDSLELSVNLGYLGGGYDELIGDFEQEISDQRELVNAPRWTGRADLEYFFELENGGSLSLRGGLSFRSKTYLTVSSSEVLAQGGYGLLDLALHYETLDGDWLVSLYGKNLTDRLYREHGFDLSASPGVQLGYYGAPRTFGVNVKYRF